MMNEELIVKIKLDPSDVKRQMANVAKDVNQSLGNATKKAAGSTKEVNASMSELQDTMTQIRNLELFQAFSKDTGKLKSSLKDVSGSWKSFVDVTKKSLSGSKDAISQYLRGVREIEGGPLKQLSYTAAVVKEEFKMAFTEMGGVVQSFGKVVGAVADNTALKLAGMVAAIAGTIAGVRNAINRATLIKGEYYEASSLGLNISQYREWAYIFESVGESADDLADAIKTLSSEQAILAEGSDGNKAAFQELGLSVEQVTKMSQAELFKETVSRLQQVEDQVKRTTLAYTIFGEDTAARLTNVLHLNNEEMRRMAENFYLLGGGVSESFTKKSMSLASALKNLRTAWTGLTNTLAELFMPVVQKVVEWLTKAIVIVNLFLKTVFNLDIGSGIASSVGTAVGGISDYTEGVEEATGAVEKLKRVTMGFDELNIVTNPNSSASGAGASGGGAVDLGGALGDFDGSSSIFTKAQEQIEAFQEKVRAFMEEWKTELAIIGAALGVLGVAGLIDSLGKALGLGEKFHTLMTNIRKLAASAIVITLQYSLVSEFFGNYIDGEGFKEYIKGMLVAALGTAALYAMWGPTGLVIGLAVTAAASLDAVIENGGITNTESFVVALTGLAAAVGAVYTAWTKAGLGNLIKGLVDKIPGFSGAFAGISATIGKHLGGIPGVVSKAFSGLGSIITSALGSVAAAVAAIPGWAIALVAAIAVAIGLAIADYDFTDLGYKLGKALGTAWKKIKDWFGVAVDWVKALGESIKEGILAAFDWVKDKFDIDTFWDLLYYIINPMALIAKLVEVMIEIGSEVLPGLWEGIKRGWDNLIKNVKEFINGFVKGWKEALGIHSPSTVFAEIGEDIIAGLLNGIKTAWNNIKNWFNSNVAPKLTVKYWQDKFETVRSGVTTKLAETRTAIINGWNNIKSYFTTNIAPKLTLEYWKNKFDTMRSAIQTKLGEVRTQVMNSWNAIKSYFTTNIAPKFTLEYWKNKFEPMRSAISTKLTEAKTAITNIWNQIKSWFNTSVAPKFTTSYWTSKFDTIKSGAKAALNGVIGIVEKAINAIVKKVNTISWKIPSYVPGVGGKKFGFDLDTVKIPRLAQGGITNGSTIANIGENGREAVLPLENNTGWMDMLADRLASRMNPATKVILKVDERELGHATIHAINQNTKQTGGLQLQLV